MNPTERRIEADLREITQGYDGHPSVTVTPSGSGLATTYRVEYQVVTAGLDPADGQPVVIGAPPVLISYSAEHPASAPVVQIEGPIFHPSVADQPSGTPSRPMVLDLEWAPSRSICEVVELVGIVLQYDAALPAEAPNLLALQWAVANREIFPLGAVDVSPSADRPDGEPRAEMPGASDGQPRPEEPAYVDPRSSETPLGPDWWVASDGRYYPPELRSQPDPTR